MDELSGRTAVVIGSGGIGRGIALGLAGEGMRVMVADIDPDAAKGVASDVTGGGGTATAATVDATDHGSLTALAETAVAEYGGVHVLANTVGVILDRPLVETTDEDWGWFVEFNLLALVRSVNVFVPHLRAAGQPTHIVLTSSMAGLLALPPEVVGGVHNGLYTTTKHALIGYCDMLRMELAPEGIGISVLCPGLVQGNLGRTSARNRPHRFGGPLPAPDRAGMPPGAMPNEEVGPYVVRGIKGNRFYIFTHPDAVTLVEERHRGVLADAAFYRT